ncbi:MAG: transcription-repair coupling factor [Bacteroidales bacterium]|nr:transcription-repair coupling factor [Bacteroidales bacterium]MDG2080543.1 transcription-repair coupling factor [Bacteroidales bacterium]
MIPTDLINLFSKNPEVINLINTLDSGHKKIHLKGIIGSSTPLLISCIIQAKGKQQHVCVLPDKEQAAYFYNDLESLLEETGKELNQRKVLFYPTSYSKPYEPENVDRNYQLSRTEVLKRTISGDKKSIIITYPQALAEKVITKKFLSKNIMKLKVGEEVSLDFISDLLFELEFEHVDFVTEPGQFAIRGGIIDVHSFSNEHPYRIEFIGDEIESIRAFDPATQLSVQTLNRITLLPNIQSREIIEKRVDFMEYIPSTTAIWFEDINLTMDRLDKEYEKAKTGFGKISDDNNAIKPEILFTNGKATLELLDKFTIIEFGSLSIFKNPTPLKFNQKPQPSFNKNFDILINDIRVKTKEGYKCIIFSGNNKQIERLYVIFEDLQEKIPDAGRIMFNPVYQSLSTGFIDNDSKLLCYTDHQIFNRYHRFTLREGFTSKEEISIKDLHNLNPGDYITHIDHGVGKFDGLQIIDNNGKKQEAIRLIYKNNDILYISIHSLHRISKYVGKEGIPPSLNKLGSKAWTNVKNKAKSRVKDIARDLIKLYAKRKNSSGIQYSPDSYLQNELEASFIYEDTPDQLKATIDTKKDMEAEYPMDRLICGDVGFGKTEIAIRAAFKAVCDSKQVAVLVPTTILALQHYKTFGQRLEEFPVNIDYINRFKSSKQQKETLQNLKDGKIDIIIGTHRILSKDIVFKDLGLFIVDEEQKFGVTAKEKLKQFKSNVDSLTLTATPIPRTLQFSLMGARDLSIMNTAPPNRHPIQTQIRSFGAEVISDAINYEISRGGQVFFIHNRVQNILEVYDMIKKFVPKVRIGIGHGQMDGKTLENIMLDFIDGDYDVLLSTTIVESGLDIPNANTIIINDAQNHGLSDLHQLRGRVGRSNKQAFCYLLSPPLSSLTNEARKRLKAIEEYGDLGSGFNIAMRDLDIRGAGNILGAEQSGFISDIGYEMYQKILDEAITELKEGEFANLYNKGKMADNFVSDCQIETDLEIRIPDYYITNITERLSIYKELDNIDNEEKLQKTCSKLIDRFGPLPDETVDLTNIVRLRWIAKEIGFTKLNLKNRRMTGYFPGSHDSPFFHSKTFGNILTFIQANPKVAVMKEIKGSLALRFENVSSVTNAISLLKSIGYRTG